MDIFEKITECKKNGVSSVLVTVIQKEGDGPALVGIKMLVMPHEITIGTVGGGALELFAIREASEILKSKQSQVKKFNLSSDPDAEADVNTGMICGGSVSLFFEYLSGGVPVYIFGAGHCGKALAYHLKNMDYYVTIVDHRADMFDGIDGANEMRLMDETDGIKGMNFERDCYIVIASPSHTYDWAILKDILDKKLPAKYIGMLGSKKKVNIFFERIKKELGESTDLSNLYTPAGLNIGGGTPEEIAISIIAEMQAVRYQKAGVDHMRNNI